MFNKSDGGESPGRRINTEYDDEYIEKIIFTHREDFHNITTMRKYGRKQKDNIVLNVANYLYRTKTWHKFFKQEVKFVPVEKILNGLVVKKYDDIHQVKADGFYVGDVKRVCEGKLKTTGGYIFRYCK